MGLIKLVIRVLALIGKEITEVFQRPGAVLSLVLGPFLILAVFGAGYQGYKKDLVAIIVVDPASALPQEAEAYRPGRPGDQHRRGHAGSARRRGRLRADQVDVVIVPPIDPIAEIEAGRQAELTVITNIADPVAVAYTGFIAETLASTVNREIYRIGAEEGQAYAITIGGRDLEHAARGDRVTDEAGPRRSRPRGPVDRRLLRPGGACAGAPAYGRDPHRPVHRPGAPERLARSLPDLADAGQRDRDRQGRRIRDPRWRDRRPVGLAPGLVPCPAARGARPARARDRAAARGLAQAGTADIRGLGFERQAVQLSLLTLLASMFFSGFVLRIEEFQPAVQAGAYALPVTHGITLMQELMLGGAIVHAWQLVALGVIAAVLLASSWFLLWREMRPE